MAESGSAGTKGQGHGNREQFDHFDRLGKVDQKNLDADKMKATDKEADVEELLATEDKTHTTSSEFYEGGYKADKLDIELDLYERSKTDIPPIEEIENDTADKPPPSTSEESEQIVSKLDPVDFAFQAQGIVTKATSSVEPQADPQLIITQPAPPIQESIPQESQEIEEPEQNIPIEETPEPPTSP
jgi:hypothetical protein